LSLDKTIDEAVDETKFEEKLEEFIRRTAHFSKTPESFNKKGPNILCVNDFYVSEQIVTNHNVKNLTKTINKTPIKCEYGRSNLESTYTANNLSDNGSSSTIESLNNSEISSEEMSFLKHAFSLIKFSMMDELFEQFKDATEVFFTKMEDLARKTKDDLINKVACKLS